MSVFQVKQILLISYDERLLIARRLLLEKQGYRLLSALGPKEALANCNDGSFLERLIDSQRCRASRLNGGIDAPPP